MGQLLKKFKSGLSPITVLTLLMPALAVAASLAAIISLSATGVIFTLGVAIPAALGTICVMSCVTISLTAVLIVATSDFKEIKDPVKKTQEGERNGSGFRI